MASSSSAAPAPVVSNSGTQAWVAAARTSRADLLIIGDSVTTFQGDGWDAGMIQAAHEHFGLAGTGLMDGRGIDGDGYGSYQVPGAGWDQDPAAAPAARAGHVWKSVHSAGTTARNDLGVGLAAGNAVLPAGGAYDLHVWSASAAGGGQMGAYRRSAALSTFPQRRTTFAPVATATPEADLQHTAFNFPAVPGTDAHGHEFFLEATTDTSVYYTRLSRAGATGVTVSSWGYGGKSTLDFYNDLYAGGTMTPAGRAAWLGAVVDGGSGKLNVVIAEGFNDRNETTPSVHGIEPGSSAAAFADNVTSLMDRLRQDWALAGKPVSDLSFTLLGMYDDADTGTRLREYAAALHDLSVADPSVSFVDLYLLAPTFEQAQALGYLADDVHPTRAGAIAYSRLVMDAIVPEPTGAAAVLLVALPLLHRSRRRVASSRVK
jgi:lysophospholipase L1-like esterase